MVQKAGLRMLDSFTQGNLRTFVDLCNDAGYPTDLGGYYLRQLVRNDYLSKGERGEYLLTVRGRKYLVDSAKHSSTLSPRVLVIVIATYNDQFVVLERQKQPFLHRKEWPASAVRNGESAKESVKTLLDERLSPYDQIQYEGTFRRTDYYLDELFDDKVFWVYTVKLQSEPANNVSTGSNLLINQKDLANLQLPSKSLIDIFQFAQSDTSFTEKSYTLSLDDFEPSKQTH